jgi:hypothetical protein
MNRRRPILAAILAVVAILFAQLAVSAHACGEVTRMAGVNLGTTHSCCDEIRDSNSPVSGNNVCFDHCHSDLGPSSAGEQLPNSALVGHGSSLRIEIPSAGDTTDMDASKGNVPLPLAASLAILYGVLRI